MRCLRTESAHQQHTHLKRRRHDLLEEEETGFEPPTPVVPSQVQAVLETR